MSTSCWSQETLPHQCRVHDGASNMITTSKLLKVATYQHCAAHSLHLLLTTVSMSQVSEAMEVLQKCHNIVTALHFKTALLEDEMASTEDKTIIQNMQYWMSETNVVLELDDQYSMQLPDECDRESTVGQHIHKSLKSAYPTRLNSTLEMVQSITERRKYVKGQNEIWSGATKSCIKSVVGMAGHVDIEAPVNETCQEAVEVLKTDLLKSFSDITAHIESTECRQSIRHHWTIVRHSMINHLVIQIFSIPWTIPLPPLLLQLLLRYTERDWRCQIWGKDRNLCCKWCGTVWLIK